MDPSEREGASRLSAERERGWPRKKPNRRDAGSPRPVEPALSGALGRSPARFYRDSRRTVGADDLFKWTEHSNLSVYKRDVLRRLHSRRLIEYDESTEAIALSPLGIKEVEENILRK